MQAISNESEQIDFNSPTLSMSAVAVAIAPKRTNLYYQDLYFYLVYFFREYVEPEWDH